MRELNTEEVDVVAGGFGAPHEDGGGGLNDLNSFGCPLKNNPLIYDPNAPQYYEGGRRMGPIVPGSDGLYYIDQNCVVRLTEAGRLAEQEERDEDRRRFDESPFGRVVNGVYGALTTAPKKVLGGD
jgi:hypothetical protein